jgi:hypothetical protein
LGILGWGWVLRWDLDEKLCFVGKDSSWDLRLQCTYYYYPVNLFLAQNKLEFFLKFCFFSKCVNYTNKRILEKLEKSLNFWNHKTEKKKHYGLFFGQKNWNFLKFFVFKSVNLKKKEKRS